jgi:competence protein ComEC
LRFDYSESRKIPILNRILQFARAKGIPTRLVTSGTREAIGKVNIDFLHPPIGIPGGSVNDNSMVLKLNYGRFSALFTGDLEEEGEKSLLSMNGDLRSLLLKVAHHGSRSAAGGSFLDRVRPRWAIISSGRRSPFGIPSRETLLRLSRRGVMPLVTSDQGAIFLETDGTHYRLSSYACGSLAAGELP